MPASSGVVDGGAVGLPMRLGACGAPFVADDPAGDRPPGTSLTIGPDSSPFSQSDPISFRPSWKTVTRRGLAGSRAWTSKPVEDSWGSSVDRTARASPFDLGPADRLAVGVDHLDRRRPAGVDLEVERRRLGLGVEVDLGEDVVVVGRHGDGQRGTPGISAS